MVPNLFAHPFILLQGMLAGIIFGFLLQKSKASQFKVIVEQLLLKDFTIFKIMLTAIVVGSIGIYGMLSWDVALKMHIKTGSLLAVIIGTIIMGIGMAILGYCPGTCVAAAAQGCSDAWIGLLGMLVGAFVYAETYPWFKAHIHPIARTTKTTLPTLFHMSPWIIIGLLVIGLCITYIVFEKKKIL